MAGRCGMDAWLVTVSGNEPTIHDSHNHSANVTHSKSSRSLKNSLQVHSVLERYGQ